MAEVPPLAHDAEMIHDMIHHNGGIGRDKLKNRDGARMEVVDLAERRSLKCLAVLSILAVSFDPGQDFESHTYHDLLVAAWLLDWHGLEPVPVSRVLASWGSWSTLQKEHHPSHPHPLCFWGWNLLRV